MKKITLFLCLFFISSPIFAQQRLNKDTVLSKDKGFFTCSGQTSSILFKQDCLEVNLDRISFGGQIMYEGTCLDANGKKFRLSCSNYVFEPDSLDANEKKTYFNK